MVNKKKILIIISIFYWGFVFSNVILKYYTEIILTNYFDFSVINIGVILEFFCLSIGFLVFFLLFTFYEYFLLTIIYFGIIVALWSWINDKIDYTDTNTSNYFRDLLKNYSCGCLEYVYKFETTKRGIVADFLSLELKKKIIIDDEIIIKDKTLTGLHKTEAFVLQQYIEKKKIDLKKYKKVVFQELLENGLITKKEMWYEKIEKKYLLMGIMVVIFFFNLVIVPYVYNEFISSNNIVVDKIYKIFIVCNWFLIIVFAFCYFLYIFIYMLFSYIHPYIRSKNGKELNIKLSGLKIFLDRFSLIKEKKLNELKLWEDYLIYSIIFGQNNDLMNDVLKRIDITNNK